MAFVAKADSLKRLLLLFSFLTSHVAGCLTAGAQNEPASQSKPDPVYAVPLKIGYRISGSYAELRGNHFHAGLDMGTAGVENVDVHAAADGWVSRVKVGPYGYGRALYISHPDGHTTVYGHLNGFAPKIDELVRRRQYEEQSFSVELFLPEGKIPVSRDEIVAFSGNTGGSGGPHLHFEVRDSKTEEPLNPLRFLPKVNDVCPPTLYGVKLYALSRDAQIAGAASDKYFALKSVSGRTVDCLGKVGLGIHCTDFFAVGGRPCGVIEVRLYDNDRLVFKSRVDHFPFALNRHVNSLIDFKESLVNHRFIQRSFVAPGNKLPIYQSVSTPITVSEGELHKIKYVVKDFAGNESSVSFSLRGVKNPGAKRRSKPIGDLVERSKTWVKDSAGIDVLIPREALYDDEWVAVKRSTSPKSQCPVFSVGDRTVPLQKPVTLTMSVPDKWRSLGRKVFVGRVTPSGVVYCDSEMRPDAGSSSVYIISADVLSFGDYTVCVDSLPPSVKVRNVNNALGMSSLISIGVFDSQSGIGDYSVHIDGQWQVFEYDYKNNRLKATPEYLRLAKGRHHLHAKVSDACGNERVVEWDFSVR